MLEQHAQAARPYLPMLATDTEGELTKIVHNENNHAVGYYVHRADAESTLASLVRAGLAVRAPAPPTSIEQHIAAIMEQLQGLSGTLADAITASDAENMVGTTGRLQRIGEYLAHAEGEAFLLLESADHDRRNLASTAHPSTD